MDNQLLGVGIFFLLVNATAFFVMLWDKSRSRKKDAERISEGMLFFMATVFGSIGVLAGMFTFRHKTRKWYFVLGIPLLIAQNAAFLYVIYMYLNSTL